MSYQAGFDDRVNNRVDQSNTTLSYWDGVLAAEGLCMALIQRCRQDLLSPESPVNTRNFQRVVNFLKFANLRPVIRRGLRPDLEKLDGLPPNEVGFQIRQRDTYPRWLNNVPRLR